MSFFRTLAHFSAVLALAAISTASAFATDGALVPTDLRCDWGVDPLGVDSTPPRLSWKLAAVDPAATDLHQSAWQVLVASSPEILAQDRGDVWDSGRVTSTAQLHVPYAGRPLASGEQVFWKLRVWDHSGRASDWSPSATWTMGALDSSAWSDAQWISDPELLKWRRTALGYRSESATDQLTPKWVMLDFGRPRQFETVVLHGLHDTVAENLGFPRRFKLKAADDPSFRDAVVIADQTETDFRNPWVTRIELRPPSGPVTARYLRLTATRLRETDGEICLALSQIVVRNGGRNIAPESTVTASDSIENELWSARAVVDGIGEPGTNPLANTTLLARKAFPVRPGLRRATLHVSGLGYNEASVNGVRLGGPARLTPGWTDYADTCLYETYDLTSRLRAGAANVLGFELASGMYNVQTGRYVKFVSAFRPLTALAVLDLEYADGSHEKIATDDTWQVTAGPITFSNVFGGEDYDARLEPIGWNAPGFDASSWRAAQPWNGPGGALRGFSHASPPFRTYETLDPVAVRDIGPTTKVYDFGQNSSMMLDLRVSGPRGATVKIIPSELVDDNGTVARGSSGGRDVWWHYTLRGDADGEAWAPKFFYQGCRYLQVEVAAPESGGAAPVVDKIQSLVACSDSPIAGDFACSNELFNRIRKLVWWAQRSNLAHVLTDCPHRERLGWLEQYHLNGPSVRYESDLARLYAKTFADMAEAQTPAGLVPEIAPEYVVFNGYFRDSPEWGSAVILAAWQHYVWTGDDTPLRRNFEVMQRYVAYLGTKATDDILDHGLGDWYDRGPKGSGVAQLTPIALTATAIYCEDAQALARIADVIGRPADAQRYRALAARIADSFNRKFLQPDTGVYATGSQTSQAMPLVLGLVPPDKRAAALEALVSDIRAHDTAVTAGDVGYRYVLRALADNGRSDVVFDMNNQSEKPGYGYQLAHEATSLTEAWDANRHASQNHFMLGQITEWFFGDLVGIAPDPAAPGFANVVIRPHPVGDITWARGSHDSPRGRISVSWKHVNGIFSLEVDIPPNTTADIHLPAGDAKVIRVGSGHHVFSVPLP